MIFAYLVGYRVLFCSGIRLGLTRSDVSCPAETCFRPQPLLAFLVELVDRYPSSQKGSSCKQCKRKAK